MGHHTLLAHHMVDLQPVTHSFRGMAVFFVIIGPVWPFNKRHGAEMDDVNASTEEGAAGRKGHECS